MVKSKIKSVTAVVPVFNEEKTVAKVINTLVKNPLINEVVCINDGSTDGSLKKLNKFKGKVQILTSKINRGKGYALAQGIKKAKGDILLFVDADLVNLSDSHITTLLTPLMTGKYRAVLGHITNGYHLPNIFSKLTGERVYYKKDLTPHLTRISKSRFGVEIYLNSIFEKKHVKKLPLKNLRGLFKYQKRSSKEAVSEYIKEAIEIALEVGRKDVLLSTDRLIIKNFAKAVSPDELRAMVKKLYNKRVRQFMDKYVLKYIRKYYWT